MSRFKLFFLNNKKVIIVLIMMILLCSAFICFYQYKKDDIDEFAKGMLEELKPIEKDIYTENEFKKEDSVNPNLFISVDVKGYVKKPGVYQIDPKLNRRVVDVIAMAGGLLKEADTSVTNLAKKLIDEMVIIIYSKEEVANFNKILEEEQKETEECQKESDSCIDEDEKIDNIEDEKNNPNIEDNQTKIININTSTKEELMTLTGIGEAKAIAIIEYRKQTPFKKIDDILNVKGIGESLFEEIKNRITI